MAAPSTPPVAFVAFTREVSPTIGACELTHLPRAPIDLARAREQHRAYERCLAEVGCRVVRLPELPGHPDAVFVEDTAVVLPELAILMRPGAPSRRGEVASVASALAAHREIAALEEPATLDGGDVLVVGRDLFVGLSARTSGDAIEQLSALVAPRGYRVRPVALEGCLHLKTAATICAPGLLLVNPAWVAPEALAPHPFVAVDEGEPFAANGLLVGERLLHPAAFPRTRRILASRGIAVVSVDVSELAKAEAGVTCSSLIVGSGTPAPAAPRA